MTTEEVRLQHNIQGILVRNYVDTQKLELQVIGHSVYIEGEFKVFEYHLSSKKEEGAQAEHDYSIRRVIMHIEQQIRGMAEVSFLEMKLSNWQRQGNQWIGRHGSP
jgi:hypothetical protein